MFANLTAGIEALEPVVWLRRSAWGYAAVNGTHILGIALLIGSIVNTDLRIIGLWRSERWRDAIRDTLPIARAAFFIVIATGLMLVSVRLSRYIENPAFLLKMGLLACALCNILLFERVLYRGGDRTLAMRISSFLSLVLWVSILGCGRAIGFL